MKIGNLGWLYRADDVWRRSSKTYRPDQAHFRPRLERLEERRLLSVSSAAVNVTPAAVALPTLSITKTDNLGGSSITNTAGSYVAGESITYTITVTNTSGAPSPDTSIVDTLPSSITAATYAASGTGGASGFTANGSGSIDDNAVDLPGGSTVVYTVKGTIASSTTGTITNTASATPEEDDDVSATDTDDPIDLLIVKSDSVGGLGSSDPALFGANTTGTATAGKALTYTVSIINLGTSTVTGAKVTDPLPANFTASGYTATLENGATDTNPIGSGNVNDMVNLPPNGEIVYTVIGTVNSTATGTLSNTANITPVGGTAITATDTDDINPAADSSLSGYVYVDANNNGVRDPGEPGIPSVPVTLTGTATGGGAVNLSTTTDSTGFYSFANLDPGTYTITEAQPTNYIEGKDAVGSQASGTIVQTTTTNAIQTITLASGISGTQNDFGNVGLTLNNVSKRAFMFPPMNTIEDPPFSLAITKVDNAGGSSITNTAGNVAAGQSLTYSIVVTNSGTAAATGVAIADPSLTSVLSGDTWTAAGTGGASGFSTSGSGNINNTGVSLPSGSTITYTVTGTITATTGSFSNTATVTPSGGTAIPATDTDNLPSLLIFKSDNAGGSSQTDTEGNVDSGQTLTYTVVVTNTGPGSVTGATIADPDLTSVLSGDTWSAAATGGATGFTASGSGNIDNTGVDMPAGSTITYTISGTVTATSGSFSNTASVTPPGGTAKTATDTDKLPSLLISKSDNAGGSSQTDTDGNVNSGQSLTYTIVVTNTGPGSVTGATVADPDLTSVLSGDTWTAAGTGGASGFATSGSGNIDNTGVNLPSGSTITYTVSGIVTATTGSFSNTATVTPSGGAAIPATDTDNLPNLLIFKSDNAGGSSQPDTDGNVDSGQTLTYTVVVTNGGPGSVTGATVADPDLTSVLSGDTWTAAATGGATGFSASGSGNIDNSGVDMPANSTITYTITGTVTATSGSFSNTASVTPPVGTAKTATDTDNLPDITITKVDNAGGSSITPSAGSISNDQTLTYTIVVSNSGPGNQTGATISDPLPAFFTSATWTAVGSGGASGFATSGSGNITQTGVDLPAGSSITYTVTGTVHVPTDTNLPISSISNTATVTAGGGSHTATDTDDLIDLEISKNDSADGGTVSPGEAMTYTVVVTNAGAGTDTVAIVDPLPADYDVTSWTAANTGTRTATGFATSGSGSISQTGVTMPAGSAITYTIEGSISGAATSGSTVTNTAIATPSGGNPVTASVSDLVGIPALSIVKSDNAGGSSSPAATGNVNPGQSLTYTVVVSNTGSGPANGAVVSDPLPTVFTGASYSTVLAGGATDSNPSGTGVTTLSDTVNLPAGGSISYTVTGTVNSTATGTMSNTATITPTAGDPVSATDPDNLTGLEIEKSDDSGGDSGLQTLTSSPAGTTGSAFDGNELDYTITVTNIGPGKVTGASVTDNFPAGYSLTSWSVTGSSGGASDTTSSGTGNISDSVTLPSGASITYTVDGFAETFGTLSNTATVAPTAGKSISATDTDDVQENIGVAPVGGLSTSFVVSKPAVETAFQPASSSTPSAPGIDALLAGLGPHQFHPASGPSAFNSGLGAGYSYNAPSPDSSDLSDAALDAYLASPQFGQEAAEHAHGGHRWS